MKIIRILKYFRIPVLLLGIWMLGLFSCADHASKEKEAAMDNYIDSLYRVGMSKFYPDSDSLRVLANTIFQLAADYDQPLWRIKSFSMLGASQLVQSNYAMSLNYYYQALNIAVEYEDHAMLGMIAEFYHRIGTISLMVGNYKEALENFLRAKSYYEKQNKHEQNASVTLHIGSVYRKLGNFERAMNYFREAHDAFMSLNDNNGLIACLNELGQLYAETGELESAMMYFTRVLELSREQGNKYFLSTVFASIGNVHYKGHRYDLARYYYLKCDSLAGSMKYWPQQAEALVGLARTESTTGNHDKAFLYANQARNIAFEMNNPFLIKIVYEVQSYLYENTDEPAKALFSFQEAVKLEKEILNQETLHQIYNLGIKELSKQREIQRLELEHKQLLLNRSRARTIIITLILVSVIIILFMVYYVYVTKMRIRQRNELNEAKLDVMKKRAQITLEAEISERKRLGMELHDGVGPLLSLVRLNLHMLQDKPELQVDRRNNILNNTVSTVDEVLKEMKYISRNMVPDILLEQGIEAGIRDLVNRMNNLDQYKINVNFSGMNWNLEPYLSHSLFRAVQEVLNNCIIHSQCREITLQAIQSREEITIMIEDDGVGFDQEEIRSKRGLGLESAASRIKMLKGDLLIDSVIGRGTIVTMLVPVRVI